MEIKEIKIMIKHNCSYCELCNTIFSVKDDNQIMICEPCPICKEPEHSLYWIEKGWYPLKIPTPIKR